MNQGFWEKNPTSLQMSPTYCRAGVAQVGGYPFSAQQVMGHESWERSLYLGKRALYELDVKMMMLLCRLEYIPFRHDKE